MGRVFCTSSVHEQILHSTTCISGQVHNFVSKRRKFMPVYAYRRPINIRINASYLRLHAVVGLKIQTGTHQDGASTDLPLFATLVAAYILL